VADHHLTIISCIFLLRKALTKILVVFPQHPLWCFTTSLWVPLGEEVWPSSFSPLPSPLFFSFCAFFLMIFFFLFPFRHPQYRPFVASSSLAVHALLHSKFASHPASTTPPSPLNGSFSVFNSISPATIISQRLLPLPIEALHWVLLPFVTALCGSWKCPTRLWFL
jgi:hypothetical protein